ncbi:MAG: hypothetical protein JSU65_05450 [Candidatus Zixiibacteriota bacterium]|nr:MAG: hypothetical protein JSU65_05450 [candidate division Zixibacteria bacterium]
MKKRITIRNSRSPETESLDTSSSGRAGLCRYEIDLVGLARLLVRQRRWIAGIVGSVTVVAIVIMLTTPNRFTSTAVILPSGKTDRYVALRAMMGLTGGLGLDDENSSALYPTILRSNLVRDSILAREYEFDFEGRTMFLSLSEYVGRTDPDKLRHALAGLTSITSSSRTGEITVAVETQYPEFSRAIVQEYLSQLESYNLHRRRSEARERVRYLVRELERRDAELEAAEDSLSDFQTANRNWASTTDPVILKRLGRLKRDVTSKIEVVAFLSQEHEVAKLDAQKDVPVVRVLGEPSLPTQKSGPFRSVTVITTFLISSALVILAVFLVDLAGQLLKGSNKGDLDRISEDLSEAFPLSSRLYSRIRGKEDRDEILMDT